jgi:prepilin-type processing-associated H-X9-DG protein
LIVISIISLIVSLIISAVQSSRESARRTQCQNNLRQFGLAFQNHEAAFKRFPAGTKIWAKGPITNAEKSQWAFHSFMPDLLPYLEQRSVAQLYDSQLWEKGRLSPELEMLRAGWANPQTIIEYDGEPDCPVNCSNKEAVYSFHPGMAHLLFADGHVQTVSGTGVDAKLLIAWLTPNQGDLAIEE